MGNKNGEPIFLILSSGEVSYYKGVMDILPVLSNARYMLADRGYDANWFRQGLKLKGIEPCIPPGRNRKNFIQYELYKFRHKIKIMFGRLKNWRRVALRYDRCGHTFLTICLAATVIFYFKYES